MAAGRLRHTVLDYFLASLDAYDVSAWTMPNGRLYSLFSAWGFSISSVRDLRPEIADYDIDGEVSMSVPRTKIAITLQRNDFTLSLRYEVWDFHGLLSAQQLARAGGTTELHLKADVNSMESFLLWLDQTITLNEPLYQ